MALTRSILLIFYLILALDNSVIRGFYREGFYADAIAFVLGPILFYLLIYSIIYFVTKTAYEFYTSTYRDGAAMPGSFTTSPLNYGVAAPVMVYVVNLSFTWYGA